MDKRNVFPFAFNTLGYILIFEIKGDEASEY